MPLFKSQQRPPVVPAPRSALDVALDLSGAIGVLTAFSFVSQAWATLPDAIPTHFDASGNPNGWGDKSDILFLPLISLFIFAMMTVLARFPRWYNYPFRITESNAQRQYQLATSMIRWLKTEMVWMFTLITIGIIETATGGSQTIMSVVAPTSVAVILATTGVYFFKAYQAR